jgi:long-chain acyl-CoA synthetase
MMLVHHFLEASARRTPHKTALICGERRLSFAQVDELANRLANGLMKAGLERGNRVVIYMDSPIEIAISIFGVLKAGGVFSVCNPSTKADKLAYMVRDERPAVLITANDAPRRRVLAEMLTLVAVPLVVWMPGLPHNEPRLPPATPSRFAEWEQLLEAADSRVPAERTIDLDLASIIYTSGSMGIPKGVVSAHRNIVFLAESISTYLEMTADDIVLSALPLAFGYGLYQLIVCMRVGATLVMEKNFLYPFKIVQTMSRERVTGFPGVPTMFTMLLGLKDLEAHDLSTLRFMTNAGAALSVKHLLALHTALPHVALYSMYGQTECQRVSYLPPEEVDRRPDSVGIPIPGTEVYIVNEDGKEVPPGEVGELVVRGSHVMRGYWERPRESAERFRPGALPGETVLFTGDLFRLDADGFLYFISRKDDIIKSRGEKVSPREIENVVYSLDGVREVAAVGVSDNALGEAIKVCVSFVEGGTLTERDIRAHCARHLEDHMVPKYVEIWPDLPKGATGKIDKRELKACAALPVQ